MSFPNEFNYKNEDEFIQKFLIPMLNRLGFSVVNYHGPQEHGKDLILAEIDRFGHVRYHAMQAKYQPSLSVSDSHGLIEDCKEAFTNPFRHPHTGLSEGISCFYAVNGGSISDAATTNYFNALIVYGSNARLLDGKALVALDRSVAFARNDSVKEMLTGLIMEIRVNRWLMQNSIPLLDNYLKDQQSPLPFNRLRSYAISGFLIHPLGPFQITMDKALTYSQILEDYNSIIQVCLLSMTSLENKSTLISTFLAESVKFYLLGNEIEEAARDLIGKLGPLTGW